jgi:integrase
MHPKLRAEIDASANTNYFGSSVHRRGLRHWFRDVCDDAGLTKLSAHGLRKAAARRLAETGCSPHQIQAITGHKSLAEVTRYTAAADQGRMAREAMKRISED